MKIWSCKIGATDSETLTAAMLTASAANKADGADAAMRTAVRQAYLAITGKEPDFIFSGWAATLDEAEEAAVYLWPSRKDVDAREVLGSMEKVSAARHIPGEKCNDPGAHPDGKPC